MKRTAALLLTCTSVFISAARAYSQATPPTALMEFRMEAEDLNNNPIATVTVGQDYRLAVFVHDLRTPPSSSPGIFSAYVNIAYDSTKSSITASAHAPNLPDPGIMFDKNTFPAAAPPLVPSGDLSVPGQINGAGASLRAEPNSANEQRWFSLIVHAMAPGPELFTSSFDAIPGHDTLLAHPPTQPTPGQIQFDSLTVNIVPEPSSIVLAAIGFIALAACGWRRRARRA